MNVCNFSLNWGPWSMSDPSNLVGCRWVNDFLFKLWAYTTLYIIIGALTGLINGWRGAGG